MAARRKSTAVMPREKELPAAGLVKPSNRRRTMALLPPKTKTAPSVPKSRAKTTTLDKRLPVPKAPRATKKKIEKVDDFVAGDKFDFGLPEMTPKVPTGPMTRSRRTSVYGRAGNLPVLAPLPTSRRKTITSKLATVSESFAESRKPPMTSTAVKSKSAKVTINESVTPIVSLERLPERMTSGRRSTRRSPFKPKIDNETVLSAIPANLTPAKSAKKKAIGKPVFVCTPQPTDPAILLRKNLKKAVENKIDERVSNLPNSSPYALLVGETENGSPVEQLVKAKKPERREAAKFVTATPAPAKRKFFEHLEIERNDGSPELPKRRSLAAELSAKALPKSPATPHKPAETENESPVKSPVTSPARGQFVTGDLVKACSIM